MSSDAVSEQRPTLVNGIDGLPDEIFLQVFCHVSRMPPVEEPPWYQRQLPYPNGKPQSDPHPGLRSYPFLGQVCRRWKSILQQPQANRLVWSRLVLDFGHELITSVHTPLKWSNRRPSEEEFREQFERTKLSSAKMFNFVQERKAAITSLVLLNGDGYWNDEREFVSLQQKHDFGPLQLGMMLGVLLAQLQELHLQHCNEMLGEGPGLWSALASMPNLTSLSVLHLQHRLHAEAAAKLSCLSKLQHLTIGAQEAARMWAVGIDCVPAEWAHLEQLRTLSLQHHGMLDVVPAWLPAALPKLEVLDLAYSSAMDITTILPCTQLQTLNLQGMNIAQAHQPGMSVPRSTRCFLQDLSPLSSLTALNLADNCFTRVPEEVLSKLPMLKFLDMSANRELQVLHPLTVLQTLQHLRVVDFRGIHQENGLAYWSDAKCTTMKHVVTLGKSLKRRSYPTKVLVDVD